MKINLKIQYSTLVIFAYAFLMIRPQILISENYLYAHIFTLLQIIALALITFKWESVKVSSVTFLGVIFYIYLYANTILQTKWIGYFDLFVWGLFTIYSTEHLYAYFGKDRFFEGFSKSIQILMLINLLFAMFGITGNTELHSREFDIYFLGRDNQITCYIIIALMLQFMCINIRKKKRIKSLLSLLPILLNLIFIRSATLLICLGILLLLMLATKLPKFIVDRISPTSVTISLVAVFIIITVLQRMDFMKNIILLLGKDTTLSLRTDIWSGAFAVLSNFKIVLFGLGENPQGSYIRIWTGNLFSAHNLFLQLILEGGIILLLLYIIMWFFAARNVRNISNIRERAAICSFAFVYFASCMLEVFPMSINILVVLLVYLYSKSPNCVLPVDN